LFILFVCAFVADEGDMAAVGDELGV